MAKQTIHMFIMIAVSCLAIHCDHWKSDTTDGVVQFNEAAEKWRKRDVDAYRAWRAIAPTTTAGVNARRLLAEADGHYLKGIALLFEKKAEAAKQAFDEGAAIAPIHPKHYLTLAKMYEVEQMQERAAKYYIKFAQALPDAKEAEAAMAAARKVDPGVEGVFDPPDGAGKQNTSADLAVIVALSLLSGFGLLVAFRLVKVRFGPGVSLRRLMEQAPELHSGIAYLIGSLRHELLKHRIGVAGDVIKSLASGNTTGPQRIFLGERLFEGMPLHEAWQAHVEAFCRVLGPRFNPRRDSAFRKADRAVRRISRIKDALYAGSGAAVRTLSAARETLMDFDKQLAYLQSKLVRTRVDTGLLAQVAAEVRGEYAAGSVQLDDLFIEEVEQAIHIEIPRGDLVLILKNILRNAVMAVDRNETDRRVGMGVRTTLEPTGQETVRLCVWDSSPFVPSEAVFRGSGPDSGLGLVMVAVKRYGGAAEIKASKGPYCKEATVRFFRVFDDAEEPGGTL